MVPDKILVSAGEASGDLYAASLVDALRKHAPGTEFFGCAGPRMRRAGVRPVVEAESLSVVGLIEVVSHIPRIYREYRKLVDAARRERPKLAILTDSPDFHFRVARQLKRLGVPVIYLVAPQVWAWRKGRIPQMRTIIDHLLCIIPFEEEFFRRHSIPATYIGHPLSRLVRPSYTREEFFARHGLHHDAPLLAVLPGSRKGEAARHMPALIDAVDAISHTRAAQFVLATPSAGPFSQTLLTTLRERNPRASIQVVEGETWDVLAHADLALAASGTVTIEGALLGTPMITFYKVTALSWLLGKFLVSVPFYSMVNLVAGRAVIPEVMQNEMSGERLAAEALGLLENPGRLEAMRVGLAQVTAALSGVEDPMERASGVVAEFLQKSMV